MTTQPSEFAATLTSLTIDDVMRPEIISCRPEDELGQVAATMVTHGIHAGELTSEPAPTLDSAASVSGAVAKMAELYVAHLLATDEVTASPSGVISSFDIFALIGGYQPVDARRLHPEAAPPATDAQSLCETLIREVMHPGIVTCAPDAPLWTVARSVR